MELIATASLVTAFIAGLAALFAPCCVGVLLPAYLASVFKNRTTIFLMTFVYFLGILTIFLPLGIGIAGLSGFIGTNHSLVFTAGALFMILLGVAMVTGRNLVLPIHVHPRIDKHNFGSIYILGVFSGIATTCCAPVLAGVLALSALPGSIWLGGLYALTFVIGMVTPLFLIALTVDKTSLIKRVTRLKRQVSYRLFGKKISVNISHLVSGIIYISFGLFILLFERANPDGLGSSYQLSINIWAAKITRFINNLTDFLPSYFWYFFFAAIFVLLARLAYRQAVEIINKKEDGDV